MLTRRRPFSQNIITCGSPHTANTISKRYEFGADFEFVRSCLGGEITAFFIKGFDLVKSQKLVPMRTSQES